MDVRKLCDPFLQIHYSFLCLVAVIKDVLETYQEVVFISQLSLFAPAVIEGGHIVGLVRFWVLNRYSSSIVFQAG